MSKLIVREGAGLETGAQPKAPNYLSLGCDGRAGSRHCSLWEQLQVAGGVQAIDTLRQFAYAPERRGVRGCLLSCQIHALQLSQLSLALPSLAQLFHSEYLLSGRCFSWSLSQDPSWVQLW